MKKIAIIYFSRTGNTEMMARAIKEGAEASGADVNMKKTADATTDDILNCDMVVFGSPNYFGCMAGALQELLEEVLINLRNKDMVKPYAVFASAGTRGGGPAAASIERICNIFGGNSGKFRFKKVAEGVVTPETSSSGKPSPEILEKCRELGRKIASL